MKLKFRYSAITAVVALALVLPSAAFANAVADWNAITASTASARPGPSAVLDYATVSVAMYDAVQAIEQDYTPYYAEIPGASGSPEAAAAKAAHDVLVNRFPAQAMALDITYNDYLLFHGISIMDAGIPVGAYAAARIIALRSNDGSFPNPAPLPFYGTNAIGVWRSAPPVAMAVTWMADVTPFTLRTPSQYRPGPPPELTSPEYTRAYNEVKSMGALNNSSRTPVQTALANFWNLNYPAVWNRVARDISNTQALDISETSRMFALTDVSMADAVITAWDSKVTYVFWRPVSAIREGEMDGNRKTEGDPAWESLVPVPPYPDYTSGANNLTASATRALSLFFGTNEFDLSVPQNVTTTTNFRTFQKFSDVRSEVVEARIYEGIHFRFADELARKQGEHVAQWANGHNFQPIGK